MSRDGRIIAVGATIAVLVVVYVVLRPGDDEKAESVTQDGATPSPATTAAVPMSRYDTIVVRDGRPVGGVRRIVVKNGDGVRIAVTSRDTSDTVHIHGYDVKQDLRAPGIVRFMFEVNADGIYEIELERAGTKIGELVVEPE